MVKNPPASAGKAGSIPRVSGWLSSCATAGETCVPGVHAPQPEKPPQGESRAPRLERRLCMLQLEKPERGNGDAVQPEVNRWLNGKKRESYLLPQSPPPPQVTMRKTLGCVFSSFFPLFICLHASTSIFTYSFLLLKWFYILFWNSVSFSLNLSFADIFPSTVQMNCSQAF